MLYPRRWALQRWSSEFQNAVTQEEHKCVKLLGNKHDSWEGAPPPQKQMHTPMLMLHSASHSEKGWNLLDQYTNLSANWYLPTFTPMQKLLPFFFWNNLICQSAVMKLRQIRSLRKTDFYHTVFPKSWAGWMWIYIRKEKILPCFLRTGNTIQHFRLREQVPRKGHRWSYCAHLCVSVCPPFSEPASASLSLIMSTRHKTAANICSFVYLANI